MKPILHRIDWKNGDRSYVWKSWNSQQIAMRHEDWLFEFRRTRSARRGQPRWVARSETKTLARVFEDSREVSRRDCDSLAALRVIKSQQ